MAEYCNSCGKRIEENDKKFCTGCGAKIISEKKAEKPKGNRSALVFIILIIFLAGLVFIFYAGTNTVRRPVSVPLNDMTDAVKEREMPENEMALSYCMSMCMKIKSSSMGMGGFPPCSQVLNSADWSCSFINNEQEIINVNCGTGHTVFLTPECQILAVK